MHTTQYPPSRQPQSSYQVPLPHHRQPSSGSSGSYPSPGDTTSQHSPGPNYAYGHGRNPSVGNTTDVKREYDDPPAGNRYYTSSGYGYSSGGNSGYGPPSSSTYYQQNGGHYPSSAQFGAGSAFSYSSVPRCSDSPPVSPVTSTPDYFMNPSSSSSASSPTSPASPANGYHYNWQHTHAHTHQSDGSSGHYTSTELPPQYNPQGSAHNPFQPPPRSVSQIQALAASTAAPRPFVCEECGMNFSRQNDLKRHHLSHTQSHIKKTHPCPYCGKHLSRRDAIKRHVVSKQCPVAAEKNYGWPVPDDHVHATPITPPTARTRGSSTGEDARTRRESITNPYPRVQLEVREVERAQIERSERSGNSEARIVVDPRSGGYPVPYAAGRS